ncbi:hypothetical protein DFP72DRAFT_896498 [Ephemerocybe angulata]|uniref:F-box domain-containing protein n=1 Tax=Ephemerocybe angulata TaxID=980116 RepID=A0A8H6I0T8_9AGAR|nr:hypothetical protein DFP72DRAFT_896498 [Tulosesus angulatus]
MAETQVPISALPPEILSQIFIDCLDPHKPAAMVSTSAPLLLTQICSPWRTIAHTTPFLWTRTHLFLAYFRPGSMDTATSENEAEIQAQEDEARLPHIKSWFSRTGPDLPLHLSISDELIFANFDSCITDYVLTLLPRIETLDLQLCRRTLPRFTEFVPNAYARLRALRIAGDGFEPSEWSFLPFDAPLFEQFSARILYCALLSLPLAWARLTRLAVSFFPNLSDRPLTTTLLEVLNQTPLLKSLRMMLSGDRIHGRHALDTYTDPVVLPDLRVLQLRYDAGSTVYRLFPLLKTPALEEVEMDAYDLQRFMFSRPKGVRKGVRKVEVATPEYRSNWVVQCLPLLSGLKHLVLHNPRRATMTGTFALNVAGHFYSVVEALAPLETGSYEYEGVEGKRVPPCPDLERLELRDDYSRGNCEEHFRQVVDLLRRSIHPDQRGDTSNDVGPGSSGISLKSLSIPKEWLSGSGRALESDFEEVTRGVQVELWSRWDDEGEGWLTRGYWRDEWYDA